MHAVCQGLKLVNYQCGGNGHGVSEIGAALKVRPFIRASLDPGVDRHLNGLYIKGDPWDTIVLTMMRKLPFPPRDLLVPTTTYTAP